MRKLDFRGITSVFTTAIATMLLASACSKTNDVILPSAKQGSTGTRAATTVIYNETFGSPSTSQPSASTYTGWVKSGTGASSVTYSIVGTVTMRTTLNSAGTYSGATGDGEVFFGGTSAEFHINGIGVSGNTALTLTFGISQANGGSGFVAVDATTVQVYTSTDGGSSWTAQSFTGITGVKGWILATSSFSVPSGTATLAIKFVASATGSSVVRLDDVTLSSNAATGDAVGGAVRSGWMELPNNTSSVVNAANTVNIIHFTTINGVTVRNYEQLYDNTMKMCYWVAYPLCPLYIGTSDRTDAWAYDPSIPTANQAKLSSGYAEYSSDLTGYDRGHQIPSADRTSDVATNKTTFYYTNMTPQVSKLNQTLWAALEDKVVRASMSLCDTLYVVTGAVLQTVGGNETITYAHDNNGAQVAVPNYYFKVLVQRTGNTYKAGIGFWIPNSFLSGSTIPSSYCKTIDQIEALTGFNFFCNLSAADQANVESQLNISDWNGITQ